MMRETTRAAGAAAWLGLVAAGCGDGGGQVALPDDAAGTAQAVLQHLNDGRPDVLWEALPARYRADVSALVHDFAGKIDAELYDETFALLRKIVGVLRDKKELILRTPLAASLDTAKAQRGWDSVVGLCETIVESELSRASSLRRLDVGAFLRKDGRRLWQQACEVSELSPDDPLAALRQARVETVESGSAVATLRLSAPGKPAEPLKMMRFEDRWLPVDLVEEWDGAVAKMRESIEHMPSNHDEESKAQARMVLAMVESVVDRLAAAKTQEQFDAALGAVAGFAGARPGR